MPNMLFANVDGKIFEIDAASGSESNFVAVFRDDAVSRVLPGEGERVERIRPAVGAAIWARGFIMRRHTACRPCLSTSVWTRYWAISVKSASALGYGPAWRACCVRVFNNTIGAERNQHGARTNLRAGRGSAGDRGRGPDLGLDQDL